MRYPDRAANCMDTAELVELSLRASRRQRSLRFSSLPAAPRSVSLLRVCAAHPVSDRFSTLPRSPAARRQDDISFDGTLRALGIADVADRAKDGLKIRPTIHRPRFHAAARSARFWCGLVDLGSLIGAGNIPSGPSPVTAHSRVEEGPPLGQRLTLYYCTARY